MKYEWDQTQQNIMHSRLPYFTVGYVTTFVCLALLIDETF